MSTGITYVVLIWEHDQLARHLAGLKDVEHGQSLSYCETVIQLIVNDL